MHGATRLAITSTHAHSLVSATPARTRTQVKALSESRDPWKTTDFGDCCGGPSHQQTADAALFERIQRTAGLEGYGQDHFSPLCIAPGENDCKESCGGSLTPDELRYCKPGQVCQFGHM